MNIREIIEEILKILNIYKNKTKFFDFCIKINFTFVIRKTLKNEILIARVSSSQRNDIREFVQKYSKEIKPKPTKHQKNAKCAVPSLARQIVLITVLIPVFQK